MNLEPQKLRADHYGRTTTTNREKRWILRTLEIIAENALKTRETPNLLEIGTQYGLTSRVVLEALEDLGCPAEYATVDIRSWPETDVNFEVARYNREKISVKRLQPCIVRNICPWLSWLFIDGCHCKSCVMYDIESYVPAVRPGGFLLIHDCSEVFATSGMRTERYHEGPPRAIGVYEAVQEKAELLADFTLIGVSPPKRTGQRVYFGGMYVYVRNQDPPASSSCSST